MIALAAAPVFNGRVFRVVTRLCLLAVIGRAVVVRAHPEIEEALARLNPAIAAAPNDASLYLRRGQLYAQHDEWLSAEANYLRTGAPVRPGQRLLVPRAPSPALLAGRPAAAAATVATVRRDEREDEPARVVYRVRKGDTLFSIARRHGVSVENLRAWNKLPGTAIDIGDRLQILAARAAAAQ